MTSGRVILAQPILGQIELAAPEENTPEAAATLLGVLVGKERWILPLSDSGEILQLPELTPVPLTRQWFAGIANIRGRLFAVSDLSAFMGGEVTPRNASARLLLVGGRYGSNIALLVTRMLGLKHVQDFTPVERGELPYTTTQAQWGAQVLMDRAGQRWRRLNVPELLADSDFMTIGV